MKNSNSTDFLADFDLGIPEIFGVIISILNITLVNLSLYAIIWYERFGTNQNQTLINQFYISACWIAIWHNILLQIPEVVVSFGFSMGQLFCKSSLILKNTIVMCFASHATAISVVKYLYIFVFKNPSDKHDSFWCFYVNSIVFFLAFLSQFVFYFLPGKNPYMFYHCSRTTPPQGLKTKFNFIFYITLLVSFVVYAFVILRIVSYKLKISKSDAANMAHNFKSNLSNVKQSLSNLKYQAICFLSVLPLVTGSYILNLVPNEKLNIFPYNYFVQIHLHFCPFFICLDFVVSHFMSDKKLRDFMYREVNQIVSLCLIRCFKK